MPRLTLAILCCLVTGALAKEPKRAEAPATSGKGCEWAGAGYVKVQGSDTCVKISGAVRAEFETSK